MMLRIDCIRCWLRHRPSHPDRHYHSPLGGLAGAPLAAGELAGVSRVCGHAMDRGLTGLRTGRWSCAFQTSEWKGAMPELRMNQSGDQVRQCLLDH